MPLEGPLRELLLQLETKTKSGDAKWQKATIAAEVSLSMSTGVVRLKRNLFQSDQDNNGPVVLVIFDLLGNEQANLTFHKGDADFERARSLFGTATSKANTFSGVNDLVDELKKPGSVGD